RARVIVCGFQAAIRASSVVSVWMFTRHVQWMGRSWTISPQPVLSAGLNASDGDNLRIETPTVVMVGGTYHMYYSGFSQHGATSGESQIGHATSLDGTNWVKDPRNPIPRSKIRTQMPGAMLAWASREYSSTRKTARFVFITSACDIRPLMPHRIDQRAAG